MLMSDALSEFADIHYQDARSLLLIGGAASALRALPDDCVDAMVTSPPYFRQRTYKDHPEQIGVERSVGEYVDAIVAVMDEVARVMKPEGVAFLNVADTYAWEKTNVAKEYPDKSLMLIPDRVSVALVSRGWIVRSRIVWHKVNAMPFSGDDRPSSSHEIVFMLTRSGDHFFNLDAIRTPYSKNSLSAAARPSAKKRDSYQPSGQVAQRRNREIKHQGANPGDVWSYATTPSPEGHDAAMPLALAKDLVLASCPQGGIVLDPFSGSGTTGAAAHICGSRYIGVDVNSEYHNIAMRVSLNASVLPDAVSSSGGDDEFSILD